MLSLKDIWNKVKAEDDITKKYVLYLCYTYRGGKRKCDIATQQAFLKNVRCKDFIYSIFTTCFCIKNYYKNNGNIKYLESDLDRCLKSIGAVVTDVRDGLRIKTIVITRNGVRYPIHFNEEEWFSEIMSWFMNIANSITKDEHGVSLVRYIEARMRETDAIGR